jgi:hypothetical protein
LSKKLKRGFNGLKKGKGGGVFDTIRVKVIPANGKWRTQRPIAFSSNLIHFFLNLFSLI